MKQKFASWFVSLLFVAIVSGCVQPVQGTPTLFPVIPTASVTETIAPKTETPTLTPSATSTRIPATPTDVPALPVENARQRLLDLLANNGNCQLPCLWGITPGISSYHEVRETLMPISGIAESSYFNPDRVRNVLISAISPFYAKNDMRLQTDAVFVYNDERIVNIIGFESVEEQLSEDEYGNQLSTPIYGSPEFIQRVEFYSLSHLLSEHGIPTSVVISKELTYENNNGTRSFLVNLVVLYPNQGIWAKYTTSMGEYEVEDYFRSCPVNARIEMNLYPPGNPDSFYAFLDKTDWGIIKVGYKPLEEATSMSVDEFYEIFRNPTDQCIETPANIWPTPEW